MLKRIVTDTIKAVFLTTIYGDGLFVAFDTKTL